MCRHRLIVVSSACLLFASLAQSATAQAPPAPIGLSNTEDARVVPKGAIRLRVLTAWTQYDQVKGIPGGSQQLAGLLNTEALGAQQLPGLGAAQAALRTLSGDANVTLSMGRLVTTADSRIVTTPIMLEYGVTSRLALGVMVPIVQTRTTLFVELNPTPESSNAFNVGANPASVNTTVLQQNTAFVQALNAARDRLAAELQACQTDPSGSVCSRQTEAQSLVQSSTAYAEAVAVLYGVSNSLPVSTIAPSGALQTQIEGRLGALNQQYESLLGSSVGIPVPPRGAAAAAAISQLQQLVTGPSIGLDSLATTERIGIGDVEISAAFQLVDQLRDSVRQRSGGVRYRAALQGVARIGTGRPAPGTRVLDVGLGTGQTSADARGVLDVKLRSRFMATLAGQYTAYFGDAEVDNIGNANYAAAPFGPRTPGTWHAGNVLQLEVTPRFLLSDFIALNGHYTMRQQAASRYEPLDPVTADAAPAFDASIEQRVGFGFAYSTLAGYARGRSSIPIELIYAHLQTIGASGAPVPNYSREQIEVRLYYQLRRRGR